MMRSVLISYILLLSATSSFAGWVLNQTTTSDKGSPGKITTYIDGKKFRREIHGGKQDKTVILFDGKKLYACFKHPGQKSGQCVENLFGAAAGSVGILQQMGTDIKYRKFSFQKKGTRRVAGRKCQVVITDARIEGTMMGGKVKTRTTTEGCYSTEFGSPFSTQMRSQMKKIRKFFASKADFNNFLKMSQVGVDLQTKSTTRSAAKIMGMNQNNTNVTRTNTKSVQQKKLSRSVFSIPRGYKITSAKEMMAGAMKGLPKNFPKDMNKFLKNLPKNPQ